jgi:hypothetical protein
MSPEHGEDQDPAPLEHTDAERVTREESEQVPSSETEGLEQDPARNPPDGPLRDVKGG